MEQNLNETKVVKDNELNGFASGVLWVCAVYQIIRSVMGVATGCITMGFDATSGALDVLGGVLSVLIAIAIILVVNKKKCGIYAFFAIEIISIFVVISFIIKTVSC